METFFTVSQQTWLFLWACVIGVALGIVFDFVRVLRSLIRHSNIAVFIEDSLYIIFFTLTIFTYATDRSRGQLRWFMFAGAGLGFIVYILTIGNLIVNILRKIIRAIYKPLRKIYKKIKPIVKKMLYLICKKSNANLFKTLKK